MYASNRPEDLEPAVIGLGLVMASLMIGAIVILSAGAW